jgi:hypothetical protein
MGCYESMCGRVAHLLYEKALCRGGESSEEEEEKAPASMWVYEGWLCCGFVGWPERRCEREGSGRGCA